MTSFDEFLTKATASGPGQLIPGCVLAVYTDGMTYKLDKPMMRFRDTTKSSY